MIRILLVGIAFLLIIGAILWWILSGSQNTSLTEADIPPEGAISLTGEIVCLPHRDRSGPQTLECAYGLLGNDSNHYGLRDIQDPRASSTITSFSTGSEVMVIGTFSQETDTIYDTVGLIEISTITQLNAAITNEGDEISHSDGIITFTVPQEFGLAVSEDQVLTDTVVPPCEAGFEYCIYYNGDTYNGTNFQSAGLRIAKRDELTTETSCLTTPTSGYSNVSVATTSSENQKTSSFGVLENGAAGSYAIGEEYRLFASSSCYQFTTRVGASQFENAASGTAEFQDAERDALLATLRGMIEDITLFEGTEQIRLPVSIN